MHEIVAEIDARIAEGHDEECEYARRREGFVSLAERFGIDVPQVVA